MSATVTNNILLVDDQAGNRKLLRSILMRPEYHFAEAGNGDEAWKLLDKDKTDLVILDLVMPGSSGFDLLKKMKADSRKRNIPVIVISAVEEESSVEEALKIGAQDVIPKRFSKADRAFKIPLKVKNLLALKNTHDLLEKNLREVEQMAIIDDTTGLFNYRYFKNRLFEEFHRASRYERPLALIVLDIDNLKRVNDNMGHPTGNRLLSMVGKIIETGCRKSDVPVRYGGDEFCVIAPEVELDKVCIPAERLRTEIEKLGQIVELGDIELTASFGIVAMGEENKFDSEAELLEAADKACFEAKKLGGNRVCCSKGSVICDIREL